jgi:ribosome-associated toxin RatA of RatAB toxin-antitoxin module|tara:strand:+ start:2135 stop:2557 length:423 start_codon:yes stop_codon:yes gene_type:complete
MKIKKEAIILEDIEKVFNIVNRVDLYKNFVPYCVDSIIISEENNQMQARLDFNIKGLKTTFTTQNIIENNKIIQMKLVDGPFKYLDGEWKFTEIDDKTLIELKINYEVQSKIIDYTISKSLEKIMDYLVKAFVSESKKLK